MVTPQSAFADSKEQTKYEVQYESLTGENLLGYSYKKIGFVGETVVEKPLYFKDYEPINKRETIVLGRNTKKLVILYRKKGSESESRIRKYVVKYIDEYTGKDIFSYKTTKLDFLDNEVVEKAINIKGYNLVSPKEIKFTLKDENEPVVFKYKKTRENMSLDEYLKEKIDFNNTVKPQTVENNFVGNQKGANEYITKCIYERQMYAKFYGSKGMGEKAKSDLLNKSINGANMKFAINWSVDERATKDPDIFEIVIGLWYMDDEKAMIETEEKIDSIVNELNGIIEKKNITAEVEKVKLIYDYILRNVKISKHQHNSGQLARNKNGHDIHSSAAAVLDGEGVCAAYAMMFGRIAERMGFETRFVVGYYLILPEYLFNSYYDSLSKKAKSDNPDALDRSVNHAWNQIKIDGKWYNVDASHDDTMAENSHRTYMYDHFLKSNDTYAKKVLKIDNKVCMTGRVWRMEYAEEALEDYPIKSILNKRFF